MKGFIFVVAFAMIANSLFSALVISRSEMGFESKELYYNNIFAEISNDRIVSMWDFNTFELTLVNHALQIYTTIDFETFMESTARQNRARIENEIEEMGEQRRHMMAQATINLFNRMEPYFMIADTVRIHGHLAYEYHVFNGELIVQRIWVSRTLQERINREIDPAHIRRVENVFKVNREIYFRSMGIRLDPISTLVESIESIGYVMRRIDYGLNVNRSPDFEREMESQVNIITDISVMNVDPAIFTAHHRLRRLDYNTYQMRLIQAMERLVEEEIRSSDTE